MKKTHIANILKVWEDDNKIEYPNNKEPTLHFIEQIASLFSAGSFYYYILNFENLKMEYVHKGVTEVLGIDSDQFSVSRIFEVMHEEDLEAMHKKEKEALDFLFNKISQDDIPLYKVVYLMRLKHTNGTYKTILHQAQTINISNGGKIQHVLGVHTNLTYLDVPIDHKISFIGNSRPSYYSVLPDISHRPLKNRCKKFLTEREMEIIRKISEGKTFNEIASELYLSPHTINTHKKNILKKVNCKNTTELVARCIREGAI